MKIFMFTLHVLVGLLTSGSLALKSDDSYVVGSNPAVGHKDWPFGRDRKNRGSMSIDS
jgi:hypothetical protein